MVRWLIPNISEVALGQVVFAVRKTAHVTEYAILAVLLWRGFRRRWRESERRSKPTLLAGHSNVALVRPWRWSMALLVLGIAALYAASDEIHQSFVPTREGRFGDVMLDSAGAALGLLALWVTGRVRKQW